MRKDYFVYILKCADESYYTGVTSDLEKRLAEHSAGTYDGFTSTRKPVQLIYSQRINDINDAIFIEKRIKAGVEKRRKL